LQKNYTIEKVQPPHPIQKRSEDNLKQLAHDIYTGRVFTDRHVDLKDRKDGTVGMVFLALGLLDMVELKKLRLQEVGMIYEYMEKKGPSGINGYPCFFSFYILSKEDSKKVDEYYAEIDSKMSHYKAPEGLYDS
tara:strand:- start:39 stop:440 length:402 start_codon:yes stop_codon:yes gene_type:complete